MLSICKICRDEIYYTQSYERVSDGYAHVGCLNDLYED